MMVQYCLIKGLVVSHQFPLVFQCHRSSHSTWYSWYSELFWVMRLLL